MTNALNLARIEKADAAARELLAAGFATKAAQGRARELASRCYSDAKSLIVGERSYEVMCDVPYETNNFRAKHAAAIRAAFPALEAEVALIERAVALYAAIKAAPIAPKAERKVNDAGMLPMRSDAFNPALRAEFMKRAPEIKADYIDEVRGVAALMTKTFGETIPAWISSDDFPRKSFRADHRFFAEHANRIEIGRGKFKLVLDEAAVESKATKYAEMIALQWFYKTNAKLGQLDAASLIRNSSGDVIVAGTKGEHKVSMNQQRILKRGPVSGELFNQFPSHLYVDGKFHTAHEYVAKFADATAEE